MFKLYSRPYSKLFPDVFQIYSRKCHISVGGHYPPPPPNPYLLGRGGGRFQHVSLINWHVYTYCIEVAKNEEERKGKRRERRGEERRLISFLLFLLPASSYPLPPVRNRVETGRRKEGN